MNFRSIKVGDVVEVRANPYDAKTHRKAVVLRVDEHPVFDEDNTRLVKVIYAGEPRPCLTLSDRLHKL